MIISALLTLCIFIYMIQIEEEDLKTKKLLQEIDKENKEIDQQFETIQSKVGDKISLEDQYNTLKQNHEKDLVYMDSIESEISKLEEKNQQIVSNYTKKKSELQTREQEVDMKIKEFEEKYNPFVRFLVKYKYIVIVCLLILISLIIYLLPIVFSQIYKMFSSLQVPKMRKFKNESNNSTTTTTTTTTAISTSNESIPVNNRIAYKEMLRNYYNKIKDAVDRKLKKPTTATTSTSITPKTEDSGNSGGVTSFFFRKRNNNQVDNNKVKATSTAIKNTTPTYRERFTHYFYKNKPDTTLNSNMLQNSSRNQNSNKISNEYQGGPATIRYAYSNDGKRQTFNSDNTINIDNPYQFPKQNTITLPNITTLPNINTLPNTTTVQESLDNNDFRDGGTPYDKDFQIKYQQMKK